MSEHQYVGFRAVDGPVAEENLDFMRRQSSRAEVTPWSFDNEYHYGDFRGNTAEMLRRGYDVHLHYANFGTRRLMIRLANGLPNAQAAEPYLEKDALFFEKDRQGQGGILGIDPALESGDLQELFEPNELLDRLLPLRDEIAGGDLRPLYLARLAVACDNNHHPEKVPDAPVPAGLDKLTPAQLALAKLYGLSQALMAAAAEGCPSLPRRRDPTKQYAEWLKCQPDATKTAWLGRLMADPRAAVRNEILAQFNNSQKASAWPTIQPNRTIAELVGRAEVVQADLDRKHAQGAARQRAKKLAGLAADPERAFRETEKLVKERSARSYAQAATLLADLREALAGTDRSGLADRQARKLRELHPTLNLLISAFRRHGFLKK